MKTISGRANLLGTYDVYRGDYRKLYTAHEEIEAVTAADILRVAKQYLNPKNRTVATGTGGLGLTSAEYSPNLLVTGNHSGLGYLDEGFEPFVYNVPVNRGKSKANPNLVSAAANLSG